MPSLSVFLLQYRFGDIDQIIYDRPGTTGSSEDIFLALTEDFHRCVWSARKVLLLISRPFAENSTYLSTTFLSQRTGGRHYPGVRLLHQPFMWLALAP